MSTVAMTILEQLGGKMFIALTGAKHFVDTKYSLQMVLPDSKHGRNVKFIIHLTPMDTYTFQIGKVSSTSHEYVPIETRADVYCDNMKDHFEDMTGLYVTFAPRKLA